MTMVGLPVVLVDWIAVDVMMMGVAVAVVASFVARVERDVVEGQHVALLWRTSNWKRKHRLHCRS